MRNFRRFVLGFLMVSLAGVSWVRWTHSKKQGYLVDVYSWGDIEHVQHK
jgi:hypothetical protein